MALLSTRPALRRAVLTGAALLAVALTARLGWWQLDRAQQKLDLQARIAQRAALPPLAPADLARDAGAAAGQHYRLITLRGQWLPAHTVWLDNRQMAGRQGFVVVTPLQLAGGDVVLVQRGFSPRDFIDRSRLPPLATPAGEVQVSGRIAPPPGKLFELGDAGAGPIRQNLALPAFSREIGLPVRPVSLQQTAPARRLDHTASEPSTTAVADDGLLRQWPAPAIDVGKHQGYAFQWFALCALITGLYVWFQLVRPRLQSHRPPAV